MQLNKPLKINKTQAQTYQPIQFRISEIPETNPKIIKKQPKVTKNELRDVPGTLLAPSGPQMAPKTENCLQKPKSFQILGSVLESKSIKNPIKNPTCFLTGFRSHN